MSFAQSTIAIDTDMATNTILSTATEDATVAEIMKNYQSNPEDAINQLEQLGIELINEPSIQEYYSPSLTRKTKPSDYTLSVYSYKKAGSTIYSLQYLLQANQTENMPGPLDYVSIEWDTKYASYYEFAADGTISTCKGRGTGIIIFNVEDDELFSGGSTYGTVRVTKIKSGGLDIGSKFTHTYATKSTTTTASTQFVNSASLGTESSSLGLSYTQSYIVNTSTNVEQWDLWADNTITLT